jgi:NADH-quinone oxidoreductase subunit J
VLVSTASLAVLTALVLRLGLRGADFSQVIALRQIGRIMFQEHGLAVELISLQLLFALVGALYLGRNR